MGVDFGAGGSHVGDNLFDLFVIRHGVELAVDAEVVEGDHQLYLYYASRNAAGYRSAKAGTIQLLGMATTDRQTNSDYEGAVWTNLRNDVSILYPTQAWEQQCVEAPSVLLHAGQYYMFYAGAYNNQPQQIGIAVSQDGLNWQRLPRLHGQPFLANGAPGTWNSSESGHPGIFQDVDGKTYLFFQGNNDNGNTWHISRREIVWSRAGPQLGGY